ncbi:hypothetical protein D3C71_1669580 [compost metagenome]
MDAAPGFDRAGDRQVAVRLEPQAACVLQRSLLDKQLAQLWQRGDVRLDDPAGRCRLGEHGGQVRREPLQPRAGDLHVGRRQAHVVQGFCSLGDARVEPAGLLQGNQLGDDRVALLPGFQGFSVNHDFTCSAVCGPPAAVS